MDTLRAQGHCAVPAGRAVFVSLAHVAPPPIDLQQP
jgi:hypothetical protein